MILVSELFAGLKKMQNIPDQIIIFKNYVLSAKELATNAAEVNIILKYSISEV